MAEQSGRTTAYDDSSASTDTGTDNTQQPTQQQQQQQHSDPSSSDKSHHQNETQSGSGPGPGSGTGTFTLLLFAAASTYTGTDMLVLPAPMTMKELFEILEGKFPGIKRKVLRSSAVSVNLEYVDLEVDEEGDIVSMQGGKRVVDGGDGGGGVGAGLWVVIQKGDEVGIIPPVSSG